MSSNAPAPPPTASAKQTDAPDDAAVLAMSQRWLERAVIGLNLCPFAKAVAAKGQIRWVVGRPRHIDDLLDALERELALLMQTPAEKIDTTLIVLPQGFDDFLGFNDLLDLAEQVLVDAGLEGDVQIASFHPQFQFEGTAVDDASNLTNRAPYPMLHLLREASVERAVAAAPDASEIVARNIQTVERLGHAGWHKLLANDEGASV